MSKYKNSESKAPPGSLMTLLGEPKYRREAVRWVGLVGKLRSSLLLILTGARL
jgi:hypothetical protein